MRVANYSTNPVIFEQAKFWHKMCGTGKFPCRLGFCDIDSHACHHVNQWMNRLRMMKMTEPNAGTRMEPMDQVFRLVLMSIPEKLVTTWK